MPALLDREVFGGNNYLRKLSQNLQIYNVESTLLFKTSLEYSTIFKISIQVFPNLINIKT